MSISKSSKTAFSVKKHAYILWFERECLYSQLLIINNIKKYIMFSIKKCILVAAASLMLTACGTTSTVPITGRKHTLLVDDAQVLSLSKQQFNETMKSLTLSTNTTNTAIVKRVGQRLANAVESYLKNNGLANELKYYEWEFNLVKSNQVNAFCMPGGKIVVYEGMIPVAKDEASLAIVLGHEIAHAVAKHSAEQLSKQMRQQYGTQILGAVLNKAAGANTAQLATALAQQGFSFANLKYSRDNETEADRMGLIFAAMAGYDPQTAIAFWQRMAAASTSQKAEILSDHPSDATRIASLQKFMPEAMQYYKK